MNVPETPSPIEALDDDHRGLRIRFHWTGDRYAHTIEIVQEADQPSLPPLLNSCESDASVEWPASPPVQQISVEHIETNFVALTVGSAGACHWSISMLGYHNGDGPLLEFDVAARSSRPWDHLGSRYSIGPASAGLAAEIFPGDAVPETVVEQTAGFWEIRPAQLDASTVRWAYQIRLAG